MIEAYLKHQEERNAQGIPALPLNPEQTAELCKLLQKPPAGKEEFLKDLFKNRISPGVDPGRRSQGRLSRRDPRRQGEFPADLQERSGADSRHHDRRLQRQAADRRPEGRRAGR